MGVRDFFKLPKSHRRARSETRSEVVSESTEGPSSASLAVPHPAESTPDLWMDSSTSQEQSSLTSRGQQSKERSFTSRVRSVFSKNVPLVSSAAKLTLRGVKETADVFPPLKTVAGFLCFILDNCEKTMACRQAVESLIPRVEALGKSLGTPVPEREVEEGGRRNTLKRKLDGILKELEPLAQRDRITRFINNTQDVGKLNGIVEDIRDTMMEYQTSLQQDLFAKTCRLIERADLTVLDRLRHAIDAGYRCGDRKGCMRGTRRDVLSQLENWLNNVDDKLVFWLNGLAGTGKSTIAQTFAEVTFAGGVLGASFFCSRDYDDRSNLRTIFPTLAFQLAYKYPRFREELLPVLTANPDV